jgi:hypothetical protein
VEVFIHDVSFLLQIDKQENDTVVVGFRDEPANFGNQLPEDGLTVCF